MAKPRRPIRTLLARGGEAVRSSRQERVSARQERVSATRQDRVSARQERVSARQERVSARQERVSARPERVRTREERVRTRAERVRARVERVSTQDRVRRRRSPELARQEILDAADRVFVEFQPDQVGLKEVAREAGVSHALITHYFGTYAGLIEAAVERRIRALRETMLERLRDAGVLARPVELISLLFQALEDPVHLRLTRWLLASERPAAAHAFGLQAHGLKLVAEQVATALVPAPTPELVAKVELALLTSVSAAYGYAIGKYALVGALGRQVSRELDAEVQHTLAAMVQAFIRAELGLPLGG